MTIKPPAAAQRLQMWILDRYGIALNVMPMAPSYQYFIVERHSASRPRPRPYLVTALDHISEMSEKPRRVCPQMLRFAAFGGRWWGKKFKGPD